MKEPKSLPSRASEDVVEKQRFPIKMTIRIDWGMRKDLELITLYERKNGSSTLVRDWMTEKLRGYDRNPHFLKFRNQMVKREADSQGGHV
ncbi:hypothetical protein MUP01_04085 [Candidatus Bathyarchaeota archaeon]|nr:hypothetical protein [Candidatus Bathyarchaeota archaeon]